MLYILKLTIVNYTTVRQVFKKSVVSDELEIWMS